MTRNNAAALWWGGFYLGFTGEATSPGQIRNETHRLGVGMGISARQSLPDGE
ncbi:MAG: hypothetical protein WC518_01710 [Patescibacteria group bacterium]